MCFQFTIKNKNIMIIIKAGTQIKDTIYGGTYIVTGVTEKIINLDQLGENYTTSTGRSSSKFYVGHKKFIENIKTGKWVVLN